ncbi:MAG: hypothetical protein JAZ16_06500 [Candidatus Thiodiazotropha taylori]|nr:hypothetical protein [Candidatus Thiodiazotropha taylori]
MDTLKTYRILTLTSAALFTAFWFSPWAYHLLQNEQISSLLTYHGHGAMFSSPNWWSWAYFAATMIGYAGLLLLRRSYRTFFLLFTIFGAVTSPVYGISIITGIEVFMLDASHILRGVVLGMAYFSTLDGRFY